MIYSIFQLENEKENIPREVIEFEWRFRMTELIRYLLINMYKVRVKVLRISMDVWNEEPFVFDSSFPRENSQSISAYI